MDFSSLIAAHLMKHHWYGGKPPAPAAKPWSGPTGREPLLRFAAAIAVIGIAVTALSWAGEAFAHAHLQSAIPAPNAIVTALPAELTLQFSEAVDLSFTAATLTGPNKSIVPTGQARLQTDDDATLLLPIAGALKPGLYTIEWHALSADGHKSTGSYSVTIAP